MDENFVLLLDEILDEIQRSDMSDVIRVKITKYMNNSEKNEYNYEYGIIRGLCIQFVLEAMEKRGMFSREVTYSKEGFIE